MRIIALTKGRVATVDDGDFEALAKFRWYAVRIRNTWYAHRKGEEGKIVYMHRQLMNAQPGVNIDHEDGDGLNNCRGNLRPATISQNAFNRGPQSNNTSGHKGVTWHKRASKWMARIGASGTVTYLGLYESTAEAAKAYTEAATRLHGEFANMEVPA